MLVKYGCNLFPLIAVISLLAALEPANMSNRVSLSVAKDAKANNS